MIGRDIGTVVLPEAGVKIYLEASLEKRAQRRFGELDERGGDQSLEEVQAALARRDEEDARRDLSPMRPAADALIIDTSELSPEETIRKIEPRL
jgi:CMP/dCMP kinase